MRKWGNRQKPRCINRQRESERNESERERNESEKWEREMRQKQFGEFWNKWEMFSIQLAGDSLGGCIHLSGGSCLSETGSASVVSLTKSFLRMRWVAERKGKGEKISPLMWEKSLRGSLRGEILNVVSPLFKTSLHSTNQRDALDCSTPHWNKPEVQNNIDVGEPVNRRWRTEMCPSRTRV